MNFIYSETISQKEVKIKIFSDEEKLRLCHYYMCPFILATEYFRQIGKSIKKKLGASGKKKEKVHKYVYMQWK